MTLRYQRKRKNSSLWWYLWATVSAVLEPDLLLGLLYNGKYNWLNLFEPDFSSLSLSSAFLWFKNYLFLEGQWNSMSHCYILPKPIMWYIMSSVSHLSHSVGSDSLWLHGLQHARLPCPSPNPTISSSAIPFSSTCPLMF